MKDNILKYLTEKPLIIPKVLFKNYKKLNITEEELIVIVYLINIGKKISYNPKVIAEELDMDKYKVMQILNNLSEKKLINVDVEKNSKALMEEYICFDMLYNKLFNLIIDDEISNQVDNTDLFSLFEKELGRTLSPMECEIIK